MEESGDQEKSGTPADDGSQDERNQIHLEYPSRDGEDLVGNWGESGYQDVPESVVLVIGLNHVEDFRCESGDIAKKEGSNLMPYKVADAVACNSTDDRGDRAE